MKRIIGLVLVLCVVAPASYGIALVEYTWNTTTAGNFTDSTWNVVIANVPQTTYPSYPFESANNTNYTAYARPALTNNSTITINTDLAPANVGLQQYQNTKGTTVIDAGGRLKIGGGYFQASGNTVMSGLIVQNGGIYENAALAGTQNGHLLTYTTSNSNGFTTIRGLGTSFTTNYMYAGRPGQTQTRNAFVNIEGSGSLINVGTYGPGGNNTTATFNFTTDAARQVSAINISTLLAFNQGVTVSHTANIAKLSLVLGSAPVAAGEVITLFDLAAGATQTGKLAFADHSGLPTLITLSEGMNIWTLYGGNYYTYKLSYVGGVTGNDVTLTYVPEPATLGLLSLGGLLLARRRRA